MSLPIISAQQRMAERKGVKLLMLGKSGIGKTTRLKDLDPATTLFLDIEAGDLAVADWPGDTIRPASWPESRDFFVFLAGPDKSLPPESAFSQAHFDHVVEKFGDPAQLGRYQTFFLDSITQLSRQCFAWCKTQPGAVSDRTGKPDLAASLLLMSNQRPASTRSAGNVGPQMHIFPGRACELAPLSRVRQEDQGLDVGRATFLNSQLLSQQRCELLCLAVREQQGVVVKVFTCSVLPDPGVGVATDFPGRLLISTMKML